MDRQCRKNEEWGNVNQSSSPALSIDANLSLTAPISQYHQFFLLLSRILLNFAMVLIS